MKGIPFRAIILSEITPWQPSPHNLFLTVDGNEHRGPQMDNGKKETSIIFKSLSQIKETLHAIYDLAGINKISLSEALLRQMHCFYWGE